MKRVIDRERARKDPYLVWNAFVDLIAMENPADLSPLQKKAQLVFWYESEVQNGGHGQYFENRGLEHLKETVDALGELGLPGQAAVLSHALPILGTGSRPIDWAEVVPDSFIEQLDDAFHECTPTIQEALERHLAEHRTEYVDER